MAKPEPATVIYNARAGGARAIEADAVLACLAEQGFAPSCRTTHAESELDGILRSSRGLIVVCGGDGTFSAVLQRVMGRDDLELAYLPMGTANNLGHALGLEAGTLASIRDLRSRPRRAMDVGSGTYADRETIFAEGFGCGVYAEVLRAYDPNLGKSVGRALETLVEVLATFEPLTVQGTVDGEDVSGEYLMLTVLNTKRIGPRLELAPHASPFDGMLDVVGLKPADRPAVLDYIGALGSDGVGRLENGVHWRGRRIRLAPEPGAALHFDTVTRVLDEERFDRHTEDTMIDIQVRPDAVTVLASAD